MTTDSTRKIRDPETQRMVEAFHHELAENEALWRDVALYGSLTRVLKEVDAIEETLATSRRASESLLQRFRRAVRRRLHRKRPEREAQMQAATPWVHDRPRITIIDATAEVVPAQASSARQQQAQPLRPSVPGDTADMHEGDTP